MTSHRYLLGASALIVSFVVACWSEQATAPSRPPVPPPSTSQPDGGASGEDGTQTASCFDIAKNKPVEQKDFLNQCNSAECFAFDNGARIERYTPGAPLPPLN